MVEPALEVTHLIKEFGTMKAVNNISFTIQPGEIFGLLGPNGAGKTTTINCITTLEKPTSGTVKVFGMDNQTSPNDCKKNIGVVPQELVHHGYFTLYEILHFHSSYYGLFNNTKRIDELLEVLDLKSHQHKLVRQLSGGMKRRLLIAKALLHNPRVVLLDEPTAGVDVELKYALWNLVKKLKKDGVAVLLTTHYLDEAEQLCDNIAIIQHGRLLHKASTSSILSELGHKRITIKLNQAAKLKHPFLESSPSEFEHIFSVPPTTTFSDLLKDLEFCVDHITDLKIQESRLEDVFRSVIQNAEEQHNEAKT